ncbi:unnamed protein product [Clonostachys chloroleuca]|uniref:Uncharacterized protein n=1 Tax=Clonostachys chloroleuca TaxID=1926264 RepID=A0AA35PSD9_9HYPO|nr:unnamed protein product [Clonostachys chloroleuca]
MHMFQEWKEAEGRVHQLLYSSPWRPRSIPPHVSARSSVFTSPSLPPSSSRSTTTGLQGLQIGRVHDGHSGYVELRHRDVVWDAGLSATEEG